MDEEYTLDFAKLTDLDEWMNLVTLMRSDFPGMNLEEYRKVLLKNIKRQSAICVKNKGIIVGVLLFSLKKKVLSYIAVHHNHRKKGIAVSMIQYMITLFPKGSEIWVSTFRKNDFKGNAPRALYKSLGFIEDDLTNEFGYPVQKFVLRRN